MLAFSILPCSNWLIQGRLRPVRSDKSAWVSPLMKAVGVIGQNVCPFWLVFLCGSGRFSCSSCMGGELEVGQNVCPE